MLVSLELEEYLDYNGPGVEGIADAAGGKISALK